MSDINVGDEVYKIKQDGSLSNETFTVLFIHHKDPNRKFYVVAYEGDIPMSHRKNQLIKVNPTKTFYLGMIKYEVEIVNGEPDFSTVRKA